MQNASHISQQARPRIGAMPFARAAAMMGSVLALAMACAMLAPAAHGQEAPAPRPERTQQQRDVQRDMQREMQRQEMHRLEQQRQEQRAYEEQQRRLQAQQEQEQEGRRHNRMTADERSELRRQINEANRDIYARPRERERR